MRKSVRLAARFEPGDELVAARNRRHVDLVAGHAALPAKGRRTYTPRASQRKWRRCSGINLHELQKSFYQQRVAFAVLIRDPPLSGFFIKAGGCILFRHRPSSLHRLISALMGPGQDGPLRELPSIIVRMGYETK
jgi:hypothetical protein